MPIILFAYFFNGVFTNLAAGFHITKRTAFFPLATGVAAAIDIGGTYLLVPSMGIEGAAWAKVVAYVASVVTIAIPLSRIYPIRYDVVRVATAVGVAGAIYAAVLTLPSDDTTQIVARSLAVPVYVGLLLMLRVVAMSTIRSLMPSRR